MRGALSGTGCDHIKNRSLIKSPAEPASLAHSRGFEFLRGGRLAEMRRRGARVARTPRPPNERAGARAAKLWVAR